MNDWDQDAPDMPGLDRPSPWRIILVASGVLVVAVCLGLMAYQWTRLLQVEEAVRALSVQEQARVQQLVQALLAGVEDDASAGKLGRAVRATDTAAALVAAAKRSKYSAPSEYFSAVVKVLDRITLAEKEPQLAQAIFRTRISLAEYRSVLEYVPPLPRDRHSADKPFALAPGAGMDYGRAVESTFVDGALLDSTAEFLTPPASRKLSDEVWVVGTNFVGARQTLDGIHWQDVKFINSRIRYTGGEVELKNVVFVNCTFEFADSPGGKKLADYVALRMLTLLLT